ncbi:MAG: DNA-3-methyladenine glycosylase family protein [Candidatus Kariarchaeaceae archaeon]|jgi:DNA-3-methyladenine glycosylase II
MGDLPFYIIMDGESVISQEDVDTFIMNNPELTSYFEVYNIELRLLQMSNLQSFCSWIISQQISSIAANKILNRFLLEINPLTTKKLLTTSEDNLRRIGLSHSKIEYVYNLAKFLDLNDIQQPEQYSSEDLRNHYTQIRGIGPWTVNMHLIFILGRMDILAVKDLVVRKGIQILYSLQKTPTEQEAINICKSWGKLATIGTLLAWEVVEGEIS